MQLWWFFCVFDDFWKFLMIFDDFWWFLMIFDDFFENFCDFFENFCDFFENFWKFLRFLKIFAIFLIENFSSKRNFLASETVKKGSKTRFLTKPLKNPSGGGSRGGVLLLQFLAKNTEGITMPKIDPTPPFFGGPGGSFLGSFLRFLPSGTSDSGRFFDWGWNFDFSIFLRF